MEANDWDELIVGLERVTAAAKRLRSHYETADTVAAMLILPEGLSVRKMLIKIAEKNGGKLIVKEALTIMEVNTKMPRECLRNNAYSTLYRYSKDFKKLSSGVYQVLQSA